VGVVRVLKGSTTLTGKGTDRSLAAGQSAAVHAGDTVSTGLEGEAVIRCGAQVHLLASSSRLVLGPSLAGPAKGVSRAGLLTGLATFLLPVDHSKEHRFQALSGTITAAVKGTIFNMKRTDDEVTVVVIRGEVELFRIDPEVALAAGAPAPPSGPPLAVLGPATRATIRGEKVEREALDEGEAGRLRQDLILKREPLELDLAHF
jgi:hypothetical protein